MRNRHLVAAAALALCLFTSSVAPTSAVTWKTTNKVVFGCAGAFCANTTFGARWSVQSYYAEGKYTWEFSKFDLSAAVSGGRLCFWPQCDTWVYGADVTFYNSSGIAVASYRPPTGSCGSSAISNVNDLTFDRCQSFYYAPFSATKMKIHWVLSVINDAGWTWTAWQWTTGFIAIP